MKGSDKTDQDIKVGILMRTKETTPTWRARVEAAQRAVTRLARLFFLLIFFSTK